MVPPTPNMLSRLEDTLIRGGIIKRKIRRCLFEFLEPQSLRNLRACCRSLHDLVDHDPAKLFRRIYIHAPLLPHQNLEKLKPLARLCCELTIKVGYTTSSGSSTDDQQHDRSRRSRLSDGRLFGGKPDWLKRREERTDNCHGRNRSSRSVEPSSALTSLPSAQLMTSKREDNHEQRRDHWIAILSQFPQLTTLTISVNTTAAWPGRSGIEDMLVTLRIALEHAQPSNLRTVRLAPVHAMGIIHLRWSGFGAFGEAPSSAARVWQKLEMLDLQIRSPLGRDIDDKMSESQRLMFKKVLHDYLRSFSATLRRLRVVWLDGDGPSPLTIDLEPGLEGQEAVIWSQLEQLSVGNVKLPHRMIRLAKLRAPNLKSLKALRTTFRESAQGGFDDPKEWIDIVLGQGKAGTNEDCDDGASSIYSHSDGGGDFSAAVSRTSRVVPFILDIGKIFRRKTSQSAASKMELLPQTTYNG